MATPHSSRDLITSLDNAFHGRGWQGPTLLGSLRGVSASEAAATPAPLKHGIWQISLHAAYWKYAVCLRIYKAGVDVPGLMPDAGDPRFPRSPSNFPSLPESRTQRDWTRDVALLKRYHAMLVSAVESLTERQLESIPPGGKRWALRPMILGVAAHDAYHCGQIQLIKGLVRRR